MNRPTLSKVNFHNCFKDINRTAAMTQRHIDRLRILDSILGGKKRCYSRRELLDALNRCIEKEITLSSLDKDIKELKEQLEDHDPTVKLLKTADKGYHYDAKGGFSLFDDYVCEKDVHNLILLFEFLISKYPELCQEMLETAVRLTSRCPSLDVRKLFEDAKRRHQRLRGETKQFGILRALLDCCYRRRTVRAVVTLPSCKIVQLVLSPLEIFSVSGELWLACTLHSRRGGYSLKVIPVAGIDDFHHADDRYKTTEGYERLIEEDFEAHILTRLKRREQRRRSAIVRS